MAYKVALKYSNNKLPTLPTLPGMPTTPGFPDMPGIKINSQYLTKPYLPNLPTMPSHYWGYKWEQPQKEQTQINSDLSNYNNPLEINSIRDVVFGAQNKYMDHAVINSNDSELNIIADTLQHTYKHYLKPTLSGDFKTTVLNTLMGVGEDLDILANPVKAAVIAAWNKEDVGQALIRSTVGDETGIHNYDYDTGNKVLDIILEVFSDPIFIAELVTGVGAAVKGASVASKIGTDVAQEGLESISKTTVKDLSKEVGEELSEKAVKETVGKAISKTNVAKLSKNGSMWKEFIKGSPEVRKEVLRKLIRGNSFDDIALEYNQRLTKNIAQQLANQSGGDITEITFKLINSKAYNTMLNTVDDLIQASYKELSGGILTSLYNGVQFVDDAYTSTVFKLGFSTTGVYPVYRFYKSDVIQDMLHSQVLNKVQQNTVNNILTTKKNFLSELNKNGVVQTIDKDMTLRAVYENSAKHIGVQESYDILAPTLVEYSTNIKKILNLQDKSFQVRKDAILEVLNTFDTSTKFKDIDEFVEVLKQLQKQAEMLDGEKLVKTGFEDFIDEFTEISKVIKTVEDEPILLNKIAKMADDISAASSLKYMEQTNIITEHSIKEILNTALYYESDNLLKLLPTDSAEYFLKEFTKITEGTATQIEINKFSQEIIPYLEKIYNEFSLTAELYQDKNLISIIKSIKNILDNADNLKPSLLSNFENITKRIKNLQTNNIINVDKVIFNKEQYDILFNSNITGTTSKNITLIQQLQNNINFKQTETALYKDTDLAIWANKIDDKYKRLQSKLERNSTLISDFEKQKAINLYPENIQMRVQTLKQNLKDIQESSIKSIYDLEDIQQISTQTLDNIKHVLNTDLDIHESFKQFNKINADKPLPGNVIRHYNNTLVNINRLVDILNQIKTKQIQADALYKPLYNTYQDIMFDYKFIKNRPEFKGHKINKIIETISESLNFANIEKQVNSIQSGVDLLYLKIENAAMQTKLNNNIYLKQLMQDSKYNTLITQAANMDHPFVKELFKGYSDESKKLLRTLHVAVEGVNNTNRFFKDVDNMVKTLSSDLKPKNVDLTTAIWSTVQNLKNMDIDKINRDNILHKWVYSVQGYVNGNDFLMRKQDMDTLIRRTGITNELEQELQASGKEFIGAYRHSALYDTAAQIKVWEAQHPGKTFQGYMLDIETTGLLDVSGLSNGNITDITILKRSADGKTFEIVYDGKIQLPEYKLNAGYKPLPSALEKMEITDKQFNEYHKVINKEITEEEVLRRAWDKLNELAKIDPQAQIMTFNGNEFDWVFLDMKLKKYDIFNLEQLLKEFKISDYYKELAADRYVLDSQVVLKMKNILERQISRQAKLKPITKELGYNPTLLSGIDDNFMDMLNSFIDLRELNSIMPMPNKFKDYSSTILLNSLLDGNAKVDSFMQITDALKYKDLISDNIFNGFLDPELQKILMNLRSSIYEDLSSIGSLNRSLGNIPIPSDLFNANSPRFNEQLLKQVQINIATTLINEGYDASSPVIDQLLNGQLNNLSQLATIGLPDDLILGYRSVSGNRLIHLDLSNIIQTKQNLIKLDNFTRQIERTRASIINGNVLIQYQDSIKSMLEDIKASYVMLETKAIPLDEPDLYYNYSVLETIYGKLENASKTLKGAKDLLKQLRSQYPDLTSILHSRAPSIKISLNDNIIRAQIPRYVDPKYMDYGQLIGLKDVNKRVFDKLEATKLTVLYPLKAIDDIRTVGTEWYKLWEKRYYTYSPLPGLETVNQQNIGKTYTKILFANEMRNILSLSPEDLRTYIIYANKYHQINLLRPSNQYFNNRVLFAELASKADALKELGVTWKYDKLTEQLTLGIDPDIVKVAINKNYDKTIYYTLNGEPLQKIILPELSYEELKELIPDGKDYLESLYTVRQRLVQMNPDLSGHPGITNIKEQFINNTNNSITPTFKNAKALDGDDFMAYFNMDYAGDLEMVMKNTKYFDTDYFNTLASLVNKHANHSHQHIEFGQFIMQGGLRLDSKEIATMQPQDVVNMLKNNPNLVVVYLKDNAKSLGGFELKKINHYTPKILNAAKELGATIIPYNIYAQAANAINKYTYGSYTSAIWHKIISTYKQGYLLNPGVLLRNAMDSTMKTFAEGGDVLDTMSAYTKAFDLLNKYDNALREIRKLDTLGRYRLEVAEEYFKKPGALLDKDTFHFIYDFMEDSGMNTISTQLNGMFNTAMKPMSYVERISRFAMYLNLQNQDLAYSEIIRRIAQTHFDYGLKTYGQFIAENYIPFVTFVTNNIMYVLHLAEENPTFLRNFFNFYQPIWDFDSLNYDELAENSSLQYQILNGNIPLNLFGYKDKEIEKTIQTKYGPRKQKVTNTAVIRVGSSVLDGISFFLAPINNVKEKLAPPFQLLADDISTFTNSALGNSTLFGYKDYQSTAQEYSGLFGNMSVASLFKDPSNLIGLLPYANALYQRWTHYNSETGKYELGSSTGARTDNALLGMLPSIFGATSRWGEFINTNKQSTNYNKKYYSKSSSSSYPKKYYAKKYYGKKYARKYYPKKFYARRPYPSKTMVGKQIYYPGGQFRFNIYTSGKQPSSKYANFIYNASHPNNRNVRVNSNNNLPNLQSIPQYLHSYNGLTRQGKSKLLSWMNMNTRFKVKTTLKRQVHARSLYSRV